MKYILLQITLFSGELITSFESMTDNQFELGKETIENFRFWKKMCAYDITNDKEIKVLSQYVGDFGKMQNLLLDLKDILPNKAYDNELTDEGNEIYGNNESDEIVLK
jgi:hypothetical protein